MFCPLMRRQLILGAFLVPYFTFLALCGMPLTMLEMSLGQFASLGPTALFQKFCPLFQGEPNSFVLLRRPTIALNRPGMVASTHLWHLLCVL